jgi:phospholipid/cholesterol/gamma-HCH transport system ATP-binding protein
MRRRAGFARGLVLNPDVVLFDEPDSGLGPVRTSMLNDPILELHAEHGGTYVLVTHNSPTAGNVSDYVALVWQAKRIHYGPTEEAFSSEDAFVRQVLSGDSAGPLGMD